MTRTSTGKLPPTRSNVETPIQNRINAVAKNGTTPSSLPNSKQVTIGNKASAEEIKEKMEQELRLQRAEHHKKRTLEMMQKKGKYLCNSINLGYNFKLLGLELNVFKKKKLVSNQIKC